MKWMYAQHTAYDEHETKNNNNFECKYWADVGVGRSLGIQMEPMPKVSVRLKIERQPHGTTERASGEEAKVREESERTRTDV